MAASGQEARHSPANCIGTRKRAITLATPTRQPAPSRGHRRLHGRPTPGVYTNAVQAASGAITGTASVVVTAPLHHIVVTPDGPSVGAGTNQMFTAQGYDQYANLRSGDTFTWSVTDALAGSIDSATGVFTAGSEPGTYPDVIQTISGLVTATASVNLVGVTLNGVVTLQGGSRPAAGRAVNSGSTKVRRGRLWF